MSIPKCRDFCQKNDPKTQFQFPTEIISDLPIFKLGDTEAVLEPKLVILVRPSNSLVALRLLGFHKVLKSVSPICNSWSDRDLQCNGISQIGGTEFFNSVGPRWFRRKPNPKFSNHIYSKDLIGWIGVFQSWQDALRTQCAENQMRKAL